MPSHVLCRMCNELVLGEIRVRLDLKDGRLDACNRHNVVNLLAVEVGQANVLCESGIDELLHRTVCVDVRRISVDDEPGFVARKDLITRL